MRGFLLLISLVTLVGCVRSTSLPASQQERCDANMLAGSPSTQTFGRILHFASPVALRPDTSAITSMLQYHGGARLLGRGVVVEWSPLVRTNWGLDLDTVAAQLSHLPAIGSEVLPTPLPSGWTAYSRVDSTGARYERELWLMPPVPRNRLDYVSVATCSPEALQVAIAILHSIVVAP